MPPMKAGTQSGETNCTPALVYRFGLRETSQPAPRIMRLALGRWKSCPYCDRYQLGSRHGPYTRWTRSLVVTVRPYS